MKTPRSKFVKSVGIIFSLRARSQPRSTATIRAWETWARRKSACVMFIVSFLFRIQLINLTKVVKSILDCSQLAASLAYSFEHLIWGRDRVTKLTQLIFRMPIRGDFGLYCDRFNRAKSVSSPIQWCSHINEIQISQAIIKFMFFAPN